MEYELVDWLAGWLLLVNTVVSYSTTKTLSYNNQGFLGARVLWTYLSICLHQPGGKPEAESDVARLSHRNRISRLALYSCSKLHEHIALRA